MLRTIAILALAALPACHKTDGGAAPAAPRATQLSLLPADTLLVISVDLARLRNAPLVAKLAAANPLPAPLVQVLDAITAKSGVDPWRTLDSIVVAGGSKQRWALAARGQRLDQARLEAAARQTLRDGGGDLASEKRGRRTFWSARGQPEVKAFLLDERTLVVAAGGWAEQMAAVADGGTAAASAASNADLVRLCQGVADHPLWAAAIVSEQLRDEWLDNLQLQEAAVLDRLTVSVDVDTGVEGKLTATLTEAAQAEKAAEDLAQWLVRARHENQSNQMFEGLLKGVTTYADGNAVHVDASLGEALLVPWARVLARYWRMLGTKLPEPSQRALPLKLVPGAGVASGPIALGDARIFTDWEGGRYAIVEITNRANRPAVPALRLVYRRKSGDMVAPGICVVNGGVLLAREKSVCVAAAPPGAVSANYDIHLVEDAPSSETRTALKVLGARLGPPMGPVQWVAGRVKNESRAMLEHPQVQVAFYDASGKLVGYGRENFDDKPLLPGSETPFQASSLVIMPGAATSFAVTASALGEHR